MASGPDSDIYTVLSLIAAVSLIAAIAYVIVRGGELFDAGPLDPEAKVSQVQTLDASPGLTLFA